MHYMIYAGSGKTLLIEATSHQLGEVRFPFLDKDNDVIAEFFTQNLIGWGKLQAGQAEENGGYANSPCARSPWQQSRFLCLLFFPQADVEMVYRWVRGAPNSESGPIGDQKRSQSRFQPSQRPIFAPSSEKRHARTRPSRLRGVPIPVRRRISSPRLKPHTWISNRFRALAWPRTKMRRNPPVVN